MAELAFNSYAEFLTALEGEETANCVKFNKHRTEGCKTLDGVQSLQSFRIRFEYVGHPSSQQKPITYDGVPFIIMGTQVFECHQGPAHQKESRTEPEAIRELL